MFEDYIQDAYSFYHLACKSEADGNERDAKMYYRASIFCAASAMEAFMNFLGDTLKKGNALDIYQLAFINDKTLEFAPAKLKVQEKVKYNAIDEKVKFIIKRFDVPITISTSSDWTNFLNFKELRDSLIHPKNVSDEKSLVEYKRNIANGLNSIIDIINNISFKVFEKHLRKSVAELKL